MFDAPYCSSCGEKEHYNGYGCNNPKCKKYYKIKDAKNSVQQQIHKIKASCICETLDGKGG